MGENTLVEMDIQAGKQLVQALDKARFRVSAALWLYVPDRDAWTLVISSPIVDLKGPRKAYTELQNILLNLQPKLALSLPQIRLTGQRDELVQLLRSAVKVGPLGGVRFSRNTVNNLFVDDAYIYRT